MKDINFLKDEVLRKKTGFDVEELKDKIDPRTVLITILVVLGLVVIFFLPLIFNMIQSQRLSLMEKQLNDTKYNETKQVMAAIVTEKARIGDKKGAITNIDKETVNFSEIYSAISGLLPAGCTVRSISFDGMRVTLSGGYVEDIQISEIISRAKRLNFFEIDEKTALSYSADKTFTFTFAIKGKEVPK